MNLYVKKIVSVLLGFFILHGRVCFSDVGNSIYQIVAATTLPRVEVLPSLQNSPGNNLVVDALVTAAALTSSVAQYSLTITGDMSFNSNTMTISLPTSISDMQVIGGVTITLPIGGSLIILAGSVPQPIPPTIHVQYVNPAQTFGINASVTISGSFILFSSQNVVSIHGSLSVTGTPSGSRIAVASGASLTVDQHITFSSGTVTLRGDVTSLSGNISMLHNTNIVGDFGVESNGTISASARNSITFANNSSASSYGVYIQSGIVQAGEIKFENNSGQSNAAGVQIDGTIYTNAFYITTDCTSSNQEFVLNTVIYEYADHTVPLSPSQVFVDTIGCDDGVLAIVGDISFSGNNIAITVASLADITLTNFVVLDLPAGGVLTINDMPYQNSIFGLIVKNGQAANTFLVQGGLQTSTMLVAGTVTIASGLSTTSSIAITSGSLILPSGATTCNAGADIAVSSGASLVLGSTLTSCSIAGNITGSGDITINSGLNMSGAVTAGTMTTGADISIDAGLDVAGNVTVNSGLLSVYGVGLRLTGGDLRIRSGAGINVGSGGLSVSTFGNITIDDNAATFYSGAVNIDSGDFTLGSGVPSFTISGGNLTVGGSGIVTLNSGGMIGNILSATSLVVGADIIVTGAIFITGGSVTIDAAVTLTASGIAYNGNNNSGTFFNNAGTLSTSGGVQIQNANNNQAEAVVTGTVIAGGNLTISNNQSLLNVSSAVIISGNISGVDIRIDSNSSQVNGNTVSSYGNNITASGLLSISNNSSVAGGTAVFIEGGNISVDSTISIIDNNAGSGSSVGVYLHPSMIVTSSISTLTMNNNVGTVYGVRIPSGVALYIGDTSFASVTLSGSDTSQNIQSLSTFYDSLGSTALSVGGGSILENASGGCVITLTGNS